MNAVLWRLRELRPREWWAVDECNGTAYLLDDDVATHLWLRHDLLAEALPHALRAAASAAPRQRFVDLRFVGVTVRYFSGDSRLVDQVESAFAGARSNLRNSPDILVELTPDVDVHRLHRSIQGDRTGVFMRPSYEDPWQPGLGTVPVVPPLQLPPFAGRFCSLHAALLAMPQGNVVVCGRRRSGKTTTATLLRRLGMATVLSDELVLVDPAGDACGVALPIRERSATGRVSYPLEPTEEGARLLAVDRVVVLTPADGEEGTRRIMDLSEALPLVAPHLRPLVGALGIATGNILEMLRRAEVWKWRLRPWPDLQTDIVAATHELTGLGVS